MMSLRQKARRLLEDTRPSAGVRAALTPLTAAGKLYGGALSARRSLYRKGVLHQETASIPVISVGNLTLGGTGKTPLVEYLCQLLLDEGFTPAVVSRGYGGSLEGSVALVSDGRRTLLTAIEAGDEPVALAKRIPGVVVAIGADRIKAVELSAREAGATVALLDDAYQHLKIRRNLNILLLDATNPFGSSHCLPRGNLREPVSAVADAEVIILTRASRTDPARLAGHIEHLRKLNHGAPIYTASHQPHSLLAWPRGAPHDPWALKGRRVLAFAGIAKPESFFAALTDLGAGVTHSVEFTDHHPYSGGDIERLVNWAKLTNAEALVTTVKDAVRLETYLPLELPLLVLTIRLELADNGGELKKLILERVRPRRRG